MVRMGATGKDASAMGADGELWRDRMGALWLEWALQARMLQPWVLYGELADRMGALWSEWALQARMLQPWVLYG